MTLEERRDLYLKPFELDEHGFVGKNEDEGSEPTGNPFIKKPALRKRLTQIDPHWTLGRPELMATVGDVITMTGSLTLEGVTRYAVGTGIIQTTKWNKNTKQYDPLPAYELARNLAKAMKTAASDLIPRLCQEFEIGGYLKNIPKNVKTEAALKEWLEKLSTPPHWALNGNGKVFQNIMVKLGLKWDVVKTKLEPDKTLDKLSDTALGFDDAMLRLFHLKSAAANPTTG